jgi:hypothetical protein
MVNIRFMRDGSFRIGLEEATQAKPFLLSPTASAPAIGASVEVRRQRRVAAVGEHAADLMRQDAAERQIRGDVLLAEPPNFRRLVADCGLAADPFAEEKDLVGGENAGRMALLGPVPDCGELSWLDAKAALL